MEPPFNHGGQSTNLSRSDLSFEPCPKFIVLHANDGSKLSTASPFLIAKAIQGSAGSVKSIKKLPSGDLLVETATKAQSLNLLKCTNLSTIPITATPHASLNSSKGVIYCPDLIPLVDSEIENELAPQGVINVKRITFKKDGLTKALFILTFNKPALPETIMIGYIRVNIRPYIPNPLRCFRCQVFGHGTSSCRGVATCNKCGSLQHASETCKEKRLRCANCKGNHAAYSKTCPNWQKEKEIQRIRVLEKVSFAEAKRKVLAMFASYPSTSYADAAKTKTVTIATQYEPQPEETQTLAPEPEPSKPIPIIEIPTATTSSQHINDTIDSQSIETPTITVTPTDPSTSDTEDPMEVEKQSRKRVATELIRDSKFHKSQSEMQELSPVEKMQLEIFRKSSNKEKNKNKPTKSKHPTIVYDPEEIPGVRSPKNKRKDK